MKYMITKRIKPIIALAAICLFVACSPKVQNPEIQKLKDRQNLLKETTKLNNLKLDLENELIKVNQYSKQVEALNEKSLKSANTAKSAANNLNSKPGSTKLSNKANKAAKSAAKDANKARKVNNALGKSNNKVKSLQKDIKKSEERLSELNKRIDFVPNE